MNQFNEGLTARRESCLEQLMLQVMSSGLPYYDSRVASTYAGLGISTFGCTPDQFPELMSAAIRREDIGA